MEQYRLSTEQQKAIDLIDNCDQSIVSYLDKNMLANTLSKLLMKYVLKGKRCLVLISQKEFNAIFQNKLDRERINNLCISFIENDYLTENQLTRIRFLAKSTASTRETTDVQEELIFIRERLFKAFSKMDQAIFGDRKWTDICRARFNSSRKFTDIFQKVKLQHTPSEYWHLRGKIEEACKLYNTQNSLSDDILQHFHIILDSADSMNLLKEKLQYFKKQLTHILQLYDDEISRYEQRIWKKLREEHRSIQEIIGSITSHRVVPSKPITGFSIFGQQKAQDHSHPLSRYLPQLKENILIENDIDLEMHAHSDGDQSFLSILRESLDQWRQTGTKIVHKMIKSLNKHNSDSESLADIDRKLSHLFIEMNESKIFADSYENTSMNTLSQYCVLADVLKNIKVMMDYVDNNQEIIVWQSFYFQLPPEGQHLIDILKYYSTENWVDLYDAWYYEKLFLQITDPDQYIIPQLLEAETKTRARYEENVESIVLDHFRDQSEKSAANLKAKNKPLYQALFKKKGVDNLRFTDLIWEGKEMLTYYYPITILSEKLLRSNRLLTDASWDLIICEGIEILNHIDRPKLLQNKVCFFENYQQSSEVVKVLSQDPDNPIPTADVLLHEYNYILPIADLAISEKLRAAKKLAKLLLFHNQAIRLFQLKFGNIISLLPLEENQEMLNFFDPWGIKEITISENLYYAVTECILETDRDGYIFINNHLLNPSLPSSFLFQREIINTFDNAGFSIVDIPSLALRQNYRHLHDKFSLLIPEDSFANETSTTEV